MEKILPIVNLVLTLVAVIVCVVVLLTVSGIKSQMNETAKATENPVDPDAIPLSQLEEFNMEDSFILTYDSVENPGRKVNVVLKLGFALNKEESADVEEAKKILTDQGNIIRARIQSIFAKKDSTYFTDEVKEAELRGEILELVQALVGNTSIIEVYFIEPIISEK